jgi:voltage-gated sodium channel
MAHLGPPAEGKNMIEMDSNHDEIVKPSKTAWDSVHTSKDVVGQNSEERPVSVQSTRSSRRAHNQRSSAVTYGFADPDLIKQRMRESLYKPPPYNVFDMYWTEGFAQEIAKSPIFENVTLGVICINAVYIAIDTDWNKASDLVDYDPVFQVMEHLFCIYFTAEWIVRFLAFKRKVDGLFDAWFVFDSCLVFMMVMETWVLVVITQITGGQSPLGSTGMLRLLRLLRLSRLMRMLRSLPELMILIKGMISAMRAVGYVMCLLVLFTYVFSIAFTQLSVGTPRLGDSYFQHVGFGMYSLVIYATFLDDLSELMDDCRHDKWPLVFLALVYIMLASMTVMNMLIGVLCDVVSCVARTEKEEMVTEMVNQKMHGIAKELDENFDERISYVEFQKIVDNKEALQALEEVGVNPVGIVDFAEHFFFDEGKPIELSFEEFMETVLNLRKDNLATVKDILDIWRRIKNSTCMDCHDLQKDIGYVNKMVDDKFAIIDKQVEELEALARKLTTQA